MMNKRKILIITRDFYPYQSPRSFRATELTKEFCRNGHEVTVIAPYDEKTVEFSKELGFKFNTIGKLKWRIFNFKKLGKIGLIYNKIVNRLLPLFFEYPSMELFFKVKSKLSSEKSHYDLLLSIAVPHTIHWGVSAIWQNKKEKIAKIWVADCGDPYCLQENDTFQPPFYFKWIEKSFMRKADYISVPTVNSFKGFFPEFHSKLKVIPQGFNFEDVKVRDLIDDGVVRFGYGGGFISGRRDPEEMINFLLSVAHIKKFEFHIFTESRNLVLDHCDGKYPIILHDPINRIDLLQTLSTYNFVVNFTNKGLVQTPSKLIDYAIIKKPILNIKTGNLDKSAILEFLDGNYSRQFVVENVNDYKIENVASKFLKLIES